MEFKDYYATLGVEPSAGDAEIKGAYRRLARKYHPDVSKEAGAEDKFKAVNEAYEALRDPQKRAAYDQLRSRGFRPGDEVPPQGGFGGGHPGFDYEEIFAGGGDMAASAISSSSFLVKDVPLAFRQVKAQQRVAIVVPGFRCRWRRFTTAIRCGLALAENRWM